MPKNHKTSPNNTKHNKPNKGNRTKAIILSVVVGLFLLYDLSGVGGNIQFYATWAFCGQKPVRVYESGLFNVNTPSYVYPPSFTLEPRLSIQYYCSPIEAERAGYSAISEKYEFPHLKAAGKEPSGLKSF